VVTEIVQRDVSVIFLMDYQKKRLQVDTVKWLLVVKTHLKMLTVHNFDRFLIGEDNEFYGKFMHQRSTV
jgi:hypothetical protein